MVSVLSDDRIASDGQAVAIVEHDTATGGGTESSCRVLAGRLGVDRKNYETPARPHRLWG